MQATWSYTCMNPRFFELTLKYLPEEPWPWLKQMVVITHRERDDLLSWLERLAEELRPAWPIFVRTDIVERGALSSLELPDALRTYFERSLGVKVLLPLTVEAPLLFTDDDVVVRRSPKYLLQGGRPWASHSGLDMLGDGPRDAELLDLIGRIAGAPQLNRDAVNVRRTDAAVWHVPKLDRPQYAYLLREFFRDPYVEAAAKAFVGRGVVGRFRLLDQRFLSAVMLGSSASYPLTGPHYRALPTRKIPNRVPDATFIHYCASGQKYRYVDWFTKQLEVHASC